VPAQGGHAGPPLRIAVLAAAPALPALPSLPVPPYLPTLPAPPYLPYLPAPPYLPYLPAPPYLPSQNLNVTPTLPRQKSSRSLPSTPRLTSCRVCR
jgi:hypothetical protein